jgi:Ca2+-binding EF-hand superfamily protein
MKRKTNRQLNV